MKYLLLSLLSLFLLTSTVQARDVRTYIPSKAPGLLPEVKKQSDLLGVKEIDPAYYGSLIEQESCIGLTHSRCWSPTSRLKTSREEGAGLGQMTRVWRSNGTLRFDKLTELRKKHSKYLNELAWGTVYKRPDLQIKAIVLLIKDNWIAIKNTKNANEHLRMADAAYNGGTGGLKRERRACSLMRGCDASIWRNNVERMTNAKSTRPSKWFKKGFWGINREHVKNVLDVRYEKYQQWFDLKDLPDEQITVSYEPSGEAIIDVVPDPKPYTVIKKTKPKKSTYKPKYKRKRQRTLLGYSYADLMALFR